jgi:hypothetical protein
MFFLKKAKYQNLVEITLKSCHFLSVIVLKIGSSLLSSQYANASSVARYAYQGSAFGLDKLENSLEV